METQIKSPILSFSSSAWPVRLSGVSIFLCILFIFFFFPNVQIVIPIVAFCFMLLAVFLSSDTSVTADNSARTLTVIKKRIIGSSKAIYAYDDIVFLAQNITTFTGQKGEKKEKISYTIALKNRPTNSKYFKGFFPQLIPMPTSFLTALSSTARNIQEYAHARELANFIGISLYSNGGPHDSAVNLSENIPGIIEALQKVPDAMKEAKKENDAMAQEILKNKGN